MTRSKHNIMRIFRFFLPLFLMGQMSAVALSAPKKAAAKPVYDHLVQPDYRTPYGIPAEASVTASLEKILAYLEANTPMAVLDGRTGKPLSDIGQIDSLSRLQQGKFRLSCYEWGVTYAAMLKAGAVTGNRRFTDYTLDRLGFLAATASAFQPFVGQGILRRDGQMRQVMNPKALDDCGAMCAAMIQASSEMAPGTLDACILNYMEWIMDKQYRLPDGHLARIRPYRNSVWLDDMFMSIPAIARMGAFTGEQKYFDEACRQYRLFTEKMFVAETGLFRHGWVESMPYHPSVYWGRANGWAILTTVELLDVLPGDHFYRPAVLSTLRAHAEALLACQSGEGFWHQLLDRSDSYLETSATAIYCYALAKAVNEGWLDAQTFGPATLLAWNAVSTKITDEGHVEGTCVGTGMAFDPAFYYYRPALDSAAHGYGTTLLAGAEVIRLLHETHPVLNDGAVMFYPYEITTDSPLFEDTPANHK